MHRGQTSTHQPSARPDALKLDSLYCTVYHAQSRCYFTQAISCIRLGCGLCLLNSNGGGTIGIGTMAWEGHNPLLLPWSQSVFSFLLPWQLIFSSSNNSQTLLIWLKSTKEVKKLKIKVQWAWSMSDKREKEEMVGETSLSCISWKHILQEAWQYTYKPSFYTYTHAHVHTYQWAFCQHLLIIISDAFPTITIHAMNPWHQQNCCTSRIFL